MRKSLMLAVLACPLLLPAGEAHATGGFGCEVKDKLTEFEVSAALSHGMGAAILNPTGTLVLKSDKLPEDMRKFDLAQALVHHWMAGDKLMLHYYVEREGDKPFASVELIIDTTSSNDDEEGMAKGQYLVKIFTVDPATSESKSEELKGDVSCMIE